MNFDEASAWSMRFMRALRSLVHLRARGGPSRSCPRPVQDLRNVNELDRKAEPLRTSFLMHDARHVGGNDVLRAGFLMVVHLVVAHLGRDRFFEYRKRSAETAALVGPLR